MSEPVSHLDLLAAARSLRRTASAGDNGRLHEELFGLRADLVHHLRSEEHDLARLPGATLTVIRDGQQRLLRMLEDMVDSTAEPDPETSCVVRCAGFEAALRRQARLEAGLLARHPVSPA